MVNLTLLSCSDGEGPGVDAAARGWWLRAGLTTCRGNCAQWASNVQHPCLASFSSSSSSLLALRYSPNPPAHGPHQAQRHRGHHPRHPAFWTQRAARPEAGRANSVRVLTVTDPLPRPLQHQHPSLNPPHPQPHLFSFLTLSCPFLFNLIFFFPFRF